MGVGRGGPEGEWSLRPQEGQKPKVGADQNSMKTSIRDLRGCR